eukprot:c9489_g1_i1.p1 GENE.c9489_g1_i1~~c9489_g1_i1.p1  ORF type:complete len:987 (-),score=174.56 c9489_g1_i1:221-2911(-)
MTLLSHFRSLLLQVPSRDATGVAVSLGRIALRKFFYLPMFNPQSPPREAEIISQQLFVEAHIVVLEMLCNVYPSGTHTLQKDLTSIALGPELGTTQIGKETSVLRYPGTAVGTLVRRGLVNATDTNDLLCKLISEAQLNSGSAAAAVDLKWCMSVIHAAIAPSPATILASQQAAAGSESPDVAAVSETMAMERRVSQAMASQLNTALQALTRLNAQHPLHDHVSSTLRHVASLVAATAMRSDGSQQIPLSASALTSSNVSSDSAFVNAAQMSGISPPPSPAPTPSPVPSPAPSPSPSPAPNSLASASTGAGEANFQQKALFLLEEWMRALAAYQSAQASNVAGASVIAAIEAHPACVHVVGRLQREHLLDGDESTDAFLRLCMEHAISQAAVGSNPDPTEAAVGKAPSLNYHLIDGLCKLVVVVYKLLGHVGAITTPLASVSKPTFMAKALSVQCLVLVHDYTTSQHFDQRPYFRFLVNLLAHLNSPEMLQDSASTFTVLSAFANMLHSLQPTSFASFTFAWMELVCHRLFMPRLLSVKPQGWALFHRLLVDLFKFMEPCLRCGQLNDSVRLLYKGTLRILLVLLHDFPEFLCEFHFSLCDAIPPSCIQLRNLILSAFPRNMRLPDPFTPNLKVDLLPEIFESPRILSHVAHALALSGLKEEIDDWIAKTRASNAADMAGAVDGSAEAAAATQAFLFQTLGARLRLGPDEEALAGTKYNVAVVNSLVLYVGIQAITLMMQQQSANQANGIPQATLSPFTQTFAVDLYKHLVSSLDPEGRYLVLNAIVNQLRYPNNHTHYFSWIVLFLFAESNSEAVKEQITRVLLERLIVHRPHPWGLLITFIELIKNPRYDFWSHSFTNRAPEVKKLFDSVAATCTSSALSQANPSPSPSSVSHD